MSSRIVPSLQEILYKLVGAASEEASKTATSSNPGRFPVVVRPETRAFLEAQANYLGGSIAGVAGAILDGVAMSTMGSDAAPAAMRGIAERFNLLLSEHKLSYPAAVEALADLGFSLADFASNETVQLKLTSPVLRQVAERFHVSYEWLAGKSDFILEGAQHSWYKAAETAAKKMLDAQVQFETVQLTILIKDDADLRVVEDEGDWARLPHFIPVLSCTKALPGGEELTVHEVWEEGRWSYARCREYIKLAIYFAVKTGVYVRGRALSLADYDRLQNARVLPATIMNGAVVGNWHPDDYVEPGSAVAKAPEEWLAIRDSEVYRSAFAHFQAILATRR